MVVKTNHFSKDAQRRYDFIKNNVGMGEVVESFYMDRGHKDGPEIHTVTTTGIVIVYNALTKRLVTLLIARPQQIKRYYEFVGRKAPYDILKMAREHEHLGFNMQ